LGKGSKMKGVYFERHNESLHLDFEHCNECNAVHGYCNIDAIRTLKTVRIFQRYFRLIHCQN